VFGRASTIWNGLPASSIAFTSSDATPGMSPNSFCTRGPRRLDLGSHLVRDLTAFQSMLRMNASHVRAGVGAEVDVVGVLVHVERKDRTPPAIVPVVGRVLIDKPPIARDIDEQHPARAAGSALPSRRTRCVQRSSEPKSAPGLRRTAGASRPSPPRLAK
jgi:hypothetical protein